MRKIIPIFLIFTLLLFTFSCQKNIKTIDDLSLLQQNKDNISDFTTKDIKIIDGHIKTIKKVSIKDISSIEKNVLDSLGINWNLESIEMADYTFSNIKGYLIRNVSNSNSSLLFYFNNGKYFKVFFKREPISFNVDKVTVTSSDGFEYMSFMLMDKKFLSHLKANKELPFKTIMSTEEIGRVKQQLSDLTPVDGGCQDLSFGDCMQCAISECSSDWKCAIMCGLGAELCLGTWTVTCTFG